MFKLNELLLSYLYCIFYLNFYLTLIFTLILLPYLNFYLTLPYLIFNLIFTLIADLQITAYYISQLFIRLVSPAIILQAM